MLMQQNWNQARALIEKIPVGVVIVDAAGEVQAINPAAQALFGSVQNVLLDLPAPVQFCLCTPEGSPVPVADRPLTLALQGITIDNQEVLLRRQDGGDYFLLVDVSPIFSEEKADHILGAIAIFQDITSRREVERRVRASEERARQLASLSRAFAEIGNDYPSNLNGITRSVAQAAGEACLIRLLSEDGAALRIAAVYPHSAADPAHTPPPSSVDPLDDSWEAFLSSLETFAPLTIPADSFLIGRVMQANQPLWITDPLADDHLLAHLPQTMREMLAGLPQPSVYIGALRAAGRLLGTLCLWRSKSYPAWQSEDLRFFQDVCDRAALAIENARLYSDEVQRNRELNALHDATKAIFSTLDLEMLLGRILDASQRALPAAQGSLLYLVAPRTGRLEVRASLGFSDPRIRRISLANNNMAERAMREKQPLLIADVSSEMTRASEDADLQEPPGSAIFAPLVMGDEVLGVLSLSSTRRSAFSAADLRLLVSFAVTTTAALHNAMLHAEMQKIAITDALTGLYNRRGLLELGRHEIDRFLRFGAPLSALMADIDHFKKVNDTYGHNVGDQVLCGLAERFSATVRQVDIMGRYGGEEFAFLLPETDLFQAANIAERLRRVVEDQPFATAAGPIPITISLGATRAVRGLDNLSLLLEQADTALYAAKLKGRNRVELA